MALQPGDLAPQFSGTAYQNGVGKTTVELKLNKGHYVLLLFYPEDFGAVFTSQLAQLQSIRSSMPSDMAIIAVSTDNIESHHAYFDKSLETGGLRGTLDIPLISDRGGRISKQYGVFHDALYVCANSGFLIGRDGKIVMRFCMDDNIGMDMKELKRIIEASELCEKEEAKEKLMGTGSDWKPGDALVQVKGAALRKDILNNLLKQKEEAGITAPPEGAHDQNGRTLVHGSNGVSVQQNDGATKSLVHSARNTPSMHSASTGHSGRSAPSMQSASTEHSGRSAPSMQSNTKSAISIVGSSRSNNSTVTQVSTEAGSPAHSAHSTGQHVSADVKSFGKPRSPHSVVKQGTGHSSHDGSDIATLATAPRSRTTLVPENSSQQGRGMGKL